MFIKCGAATFLLVKKCMHLFHTIAVNIYGIDIVVRGLSGRCHDHWTNRNLLFNGGDSNPDHKQIHIPIQVLSDPQAKIKKVKNHFQIIRAIMKELQHSIFLGIVQIFSCLNVHTLIHEPGHPYDIRRWSQKIPIPNYLYLIT